MRFFFFIFFQFIIENTTDKQILMKNDELLRDDGHFGCINQHTEDDELIQIFGSSLRSMESELESEQSMTNKTKEGMYNFKVFCFS